MPMRYEVIVVETMTREWKVAIWANGVEDILRKNDNGSIPFQEDGYIRNGETFSAKVRQISEVRTNNDVVIWKDGELIDN